MVLVRATVLLTSAAVLVLGLGAVRIAAGYAPEAAPRAHGSASSIAGAGVCAVVAASPGPRPVRVILPSMHEQVRAAAVSCSPSAGASAVASHRPEPLRKADMAGL